MTRFFLNKIIVSTLFSVLIAPSLSAAIAGQKIGYIDFNRALQKEYKAQKILADLQIEEKRIRDESEKKQKVFQARVSKFEAQMQGLSVMSQKAQENKKKELEKTQLALAADYQALQKELYEQGQILEKKKQETLLKLREENQKILDDLAKSDGFYMILDASVVVSLSNEAKKNEVTDLVSEKYNKVYPLEPAGKKKPQGKTAPKKK